MKYLKITLIVAILAAVILATIILPGLKGEKIKAPSFSNPIANQWKEKINNLCNGKNWVDSTYISIETGVQTDYKMENLSYDEKSALTDYLFAFSCLYLDTTADNLFKKSSYPDSDVQRCRSALTLLLAKQTAEQRNSHLSKANALISTYSRIMSLINPSRQARYVKPFEAFPEIDAARSKAEIQSMQYYKSHFSNNPTITSAVNSLERIVRDAETQYYNDLERLIEQHYNSTKDYVALNYDDAELQEICPNSEASHRLERFISNI